MNKKQSFIKCTNSWKWNEHFVEALQSTCSMQKVRAVVYCLWRGLTPLISELLSSFFALPVLKMTALLCTSHRSSSMIFFPWLCKTFWLVKVMYNFNSSLQRYSTENDESGKYPSLDFFKAGRNSGAYDGNTRNGYFIYTPSGELHSSNYYSGG